MASLGTTRRKALMVSLLVLASGYWTWNARSNENTLDQTPGTLVLSIASTTDASDASALLLTIQRVELRTAADDRVALMTNDKTFNIMTLKAHWQSTHLTTATIPAGTYDQLRLLVSRVQISTNDGALKQVHMPANEIIINGPIDITPEETTSVALHFLTDKSIHLTKEKVYIFAPIIEITNRNNAEIKRVGSSTIMANGGTTHTTTIGMNLTGEMKNSFQLSPTASLEFKRGVITMSKAKIRK